MNEIKEAGNFIYRYDGDTMTVAKKNVFSGVAGEIEVNKKMNGISKRTGFFCDLQYAGKNYVGIMFKAIPEEKLVPILSQ